MGAHGHNLAGKKWNKLSDMPIYTKAMAFFTFVQKLYNLIHYYHTLLTKELILDSLKSTQPYLMASHTQSLSDQT